MHVTARGRVFSSALDAKTPEAAVREATRVVARVLRYGLGLAATTPCSYVIEQWDLLEAHSVIAPRRRRRRARS